MQQCNHEQHEIEYGPAPHNCYYKINKQIGQSKLKPLSEYPDNFLPDFLECSQQEIQDFINSGKIPINLCGTYYCPKCRNGNQPIIAIKEAKKYIKEKKMDYIKKFKIKDIGCEIITITNAYSNNEKETKITIKEDLHDDIFDLMKKLSPIARQILMLPSNYPTNRVAGELLDMRIGGISWSLNEETEIKGVVLTVSAELSTSNAPANFNTPHLPFEPYSEQAGDYEPPVFPLEGLPILRMIEQEIELIIGGKRAPNAQTCLFDSLNSNKEAKFLRSEIAQGKTSVYTPNTTINKDGLHHH